MGILLPEYTQPQLKALCETPFLHSSFIITTKKQRLPDLAGHVLLNMHACFAAKQRETARAGFHWGLGLHKVSHCWLLRNPATERMGLNAPLFYG